MLKKTDGEKSPTDSPAEDTDHENDVTDKYENIIVTIQDTSFEDDIRFINGLINAKFFSSLSNPTAQASFKENLRRYMLLAWVIDSYPHLIVGVDHSELLKIDKFVRHKLHDFAKGSYACFSPNLFIPELRLSSSAGFSASDFAKKYFICPPFTVKLVVDDNDVADRKELASLLISKVRTELLNESATS